MSSHIEEEISQSRGLQPRALIVTIYGLYAREADGWFSVNTLVRLMAGLGVEEPAVRSSISRLKRRGMLEARRSQGAAGYTLSADARSILDEGDRRIFQRPRATVGDGWILAVFSVPEEERQKRYTLRSRLTWLGFGTVSSGVWIAPRHLYEETRDVLERYGLAQYVDLFGADHLGFEDLSDRVSSWWDLVALQRLYDEFTAMQEPVAARWRDRERGRTRQRDHDRDACADYVTALTAWRKLPFLDPGLPPELLPEKWSGAAANDLFLTLRERLQESAHRYVEEMRGHRPGG